MATGIKEIARIAGVSVGAVSDILNRGREHLYSAETRGKVLQCSRQMGYLPNRSAQAMRSRKTRFIGFVAPNLFEDGSLFNTDRHPFVVGLGRELATAGYHVASLDCSNLEDPARETRPWTLDDQFFDGLVIHYGISDRAARFAGNLGVPLIWWDSGFFATHGCIYRDERQVGQELTARLIEMGHCRIGFMAGERGWHAYQSGGTIHYSFKQRYESYRDEMEAHGLKPTPILGYEPEAFARQLKEHDITALMIQVPFCGTISQSAQMLSWRIPQELTVVTLDRETRLRSRGLELGGMLYDRVAAGQRAAKMILAALEPVAAPVDSVRITSEFAPGNSVAPPRK